MPTPVPPSAIRDTIPGPAANFCEKFLKLLALPGLVSRIYSYWYNEDLSFSDDFTADLCAVKCNCSTTGGGGGTAPPGTPPPDLTVPKPTGVAATDGTIVNRVDVTWNAVTSINSYEVWRASGVGAVTDISQAVMVNSTTGTSYADTNVVVGTTYTYWVRAKRGMAFSAYSDPDIGYPQPNGVNGYQQFTTAGPHSFKVPPGVLSVIFTGIGGGGGGGGAASSVQQGGASAAGAGGGGGGGSGTFTSAPITLAQPEETFTVIVGAGGISGGSLRTIQGQPAVAPNGVPGGPSLLNRGGTTLASAGPGQGGQGGIAQINGQGGIGGASQGSNASAGTNGAASDYGYGPGGVGGQGGAGIIGAGGNGGSTSGGVFYNSTAGRAGSVTISW